MHTLRTMPLRPCPTFSNRPPARGSKHARRCIKVLCLVGLTSLSSICWSSEATCLDVLFAPAGMPAMLMRSTAVPRGSLARDQNPTWRTTLRWLHAGDRCKPRPRALRLRSRSSQFARLLPFLSHFAQCMHRLHREFPQSVHDFVCAPFSLWSDGLHSLPFCPPS